MKYLNVIPTKETVDYDTIYYFNDAALVKKAFPRYYQNRDIVPAHVTQIEQSILKDKHGSKYIDVVRIDINTLSIADGQHRKEAFLKAWAKGSTELMRVRFEDYPEDYMRIVTDINNTQKSWGINDNEHYLLTEDNKHMLNIKEFGLTHSLTQKRNKSGKVTGYKTRYVMAILLGRNATKEIKDGSIEVTDKDIEFGEQIYGELDMLVKALGYSLSAWFESFAIAWYNIRKDKAYNDIINELGMDVICNNIYALFNGWHPVTKTTEWENRFRTSIYHLKHMIDTKQEGVA